MTFGLQVSGYAQVYPTGLGIMPMQVKLFGEIDASQERRANLITLNDLPTISQRRITRLAIAGWFLYCASLATPGADLRSFGARMLVFAPIYGISELSSQNLAGKLVGISLLVAFAANISVFVPLPRWLRIAAILAPWAAFAAYAFRVHPVTADKLLRIAYSFPWAIGLALINAARITASNRVHRG